MRPVSLTFDNGPTAGVTEAVLDILAGEDVKATFFVVGRQLEEPAGRRLAERARAEGHRLGNHTYSHTTPLGLLEDGASLREIAATQSLLGALGRERLFRPFGDAGRIGPHLLSRAARDHLAAGGFTCVLWNAVPHDWDDPEGWVETALALCASRAWPVVVLHDVAGGAMRHLPRFLRSLRRSGMEPVLDYPRDCLPIIAGKLQPGAERFVAPRKPSLPPL